MVTGFDRFRSNMFIEVKISCDYWAEGEVLACREGGEGGSAVKCQILLGGRGGERSQG